MYYGDLGVVRKSRGPVFLFWLDPPPLLLLLRSLKSFAPVVFHGLAQLARR